MDISDLTDDNIVYIGTRGENVQVIYAKKPASLRAKQTLSRLTCCKKKEDVDGKVNPFKRQDSSEIRVENEKEENEMSIRDSDTELEEVEEDEEHNKIHRKVL